MQGGEQGDLCGEATSRMEEWVGHRSTTDPSGSCGPGAQTTGLWLSSLEPGASQVWWCERWNVLNLNEGYSFGGQDKDSTCHRAFSQSPRLLFFSLNISLAEGTYSVRGF